MPLWHARVPDAARAEKAPVPALMNEACCTQKACEVLFWSGGKDSDLAYRYWRREPQMAARDIVLLTTFDGPSRLVAHQEIPFPRIQTQSVHLRAPLLGIPLYPGLDYLVSFQGPFGRVRRADEVIALIEQEIGVSQS